MEEKAQRTLWVMSAEVAAEFYDRCLRTESLTEADRIRILEQLAAEGQIQAAYKTARTLPEILEDFKKQGRTTLYYGKEQSNGEEISE